MKKERVHYFKEKLLAEKALLEAELSSLGKQDSNGDWSATPAAHTDVGDEGDEAGFIEEFDSKTARMGSLETRYQQIMKALDRVAAGTYGRCLKSGELIEEDRLEANPAAETSKAMMNS